MRKLILLAACLNMTLLGCGSSEPELAPTKPFITPAQRAKMNVEERDDPYTLSRLQTAPVRRQP